MRRILFHIIAVLSLLLCLTSAVLWYRSYNITSPSLKIADSINIRKTDPRYWIVTHPGRLTLCRQVGKNWDHPLKGFKFLGVDFGGLHGQGSMLWNLIVPFWLLTTLTAILPLLEIPLLLRAYRHQLRNRAGLCPTCGYDLRASTSVCPECGQPAPAPPGSALLNSEFQTSLSLSCKLQPISAQQWLSGTANVAISKA